MPPTQTRTPIKEGAFDEVANGLIQIPAFPPDEWLMPLDESIDPYDVIVEPNGHIHGYPAATWEDCHLSYPNECVNPPRSMTDYALFKVGQITTASGKVVRTGPITLKGGHAPHGVSRQSAQAHYDDTMSACADVNIGENRHGIWINGSIRPDTTVADVRRAMASGFSGDWREFEGNLELIAFSAVNTPGFRRRAVVYNREVSMAASMGTVVGDRRLVLCAAIDMPRKTTHAGLAVRALDTGRVLLTQRSHFHGDDPECRGKWEFPGGSLDAGEEPREGAVREFVEETGLALPEGVRFAGDYPTGTYMTVMVDVPSEGFTQAAQMLANEVIGIGWFDPTAIMTLCRPEMRDLDIEAIWPSIDAATGEPEDTDSVMASAAERIARSIGRDYDARMKALRERVFR